LTRERIVAPGFIDVHTHIEGAVEKVPRGDNYLLDGVTTVITGNCGGSELNLTDWFDASGNSWARSERGHFDRAQHGAPRSDGHREPPRDSR
jgi:hypothetical protein